MLASVGFESATAASDNPNLKAVLGTGVHGHLESDIQHQNFFVLCGIKGLGQRCSQAIAHFIAEDCHKQGGVQCV